MRRRVPPNEHGALAVVGANPTAPGAEPVASRPRPRPRAPWWLLPAAVAAVVAIAGCGESDRQGGPVVYQSPEGLAIVNDDGSAKHTALRTFTPDPFHADWSPDGSRIAFVADEPDGTRDIWTAEADGSNLRWASARADEEQMTGSALGVIDLAASTSTVHRITEFASFASYPDWHPSDDLIVFQAGSLDPFTFRGGSSNLFTIRPDGTDLTALTSRGSEKPWLALPTWTPDGDRILVTLVHALGEHTLATLDREGGDLRELVGPDGETPVRGAHPRQSREDPR